MPRITRRNKPLPLNQEPAAELSFDDDDAPPARAGDRVSDAEFREEFPPSRTREAGMTGGENPGGEVTADDLTPETLLDEHRSRTPSDHDDREAFDTMLREVDESQIGGGAGKDEAELANEEPQENRHSGESSGA